jgi:cytohesin
LKKGADVNAKDDWGDTALVAAVCHADSNKPKDQRRVNTQLVKTLLDNGAKVNVPDSGWTPLRCAASHGSNETVTMLLANGANLEARGASGMAALAQAIYDQQPTTFELLLKAGADVNSKDMSGYTPLMMAVRRRRRHECSQHRGPNRIVDRGGTPRLPGDRRDS